MGDLSEIGLLISVEMPRLIAVARSSLPNAQAEPDGCLARKVPARSAEIALSVTSNRLGSSASLG